MTDLTSMDVRLSGHFIAIDAKKIRRMIVKNLESRVNQYKTLIVKVKGKELRYLAIIKSKPDVRTQLAICLLYTSPSPRD